MALYSYGLHDDVQDFQRLGMPFHPAGLHSYMYSYMAYIVMALYSYGLV